MALLSRRWVLGLVSMAVLAGLLAALAHAPPMRRYALAQGLAYLDSSLGIVGRAERLDYNLFGARARVAGLVLAARGHEDTPFLEVDDIRVVVPWRVLRGIAEWHAVELTGVRVRIERNEDGSSNLPDTGEPDPDGTPRERVPVGPLVVRDLSLEWVDHELDLSLSLKGFQTGLDGSPAGVSGRFSGVDASGIAWRGRQTSVTMLEGQLSFDGRDLDLSDVVMDLPEARLGLSGRIAAIFSAPSFDLEWTADASLERLVPWFAEDESLSGDVRATGRATGPVASPELSFTGTSDAIAWRDLDLAELTARGRVNRERLVLDDVEAALAGGWVSAAGVLSFEDDGGNRVDGEWRDLDLASLLAMVVEDGIQLESTLTGRIATSWQGGDLSSLDGTLEQTARPSGGRRGLALAGSARLHAADGAWRLDGRHEIAGAVSVDHIWHGALDPNSITASGLAGTARATIPDAGALWSRVLAPLAGLEPDHRAVAGAMAADLQFHGTIEAPGVSGRLTSEDLVVDTAGPGSLDARFEVDLHRLVVPSATLRLGGNEVEADLRLTFDTGAIAGRLEASLDDLPAFTTMIDRPWRPSAGTVSVSAGFGGRTDQILIDAAIEARHIEAGGQHVDRLTAGIRFEGDRLFVDDLELAQGDGRLHASGRYGFERGEYAISLEGDRLRLAPLPSADPGEQPLPLASQVSLRFAGEGTVAVPFGEGQVVLTDATWEGRDLGRVSADLRLDGRSLVVVASAPLWRAEGRAALRLEEPRQLRVDARMDRGDVPRMVETFAGVSSPVSGRIDLAVHLQMLVDDLSSIEVEAWLEDADLALGDTTIQLTEPSLFRYTGDELHAERLELSIGGSTLTAGGRLPRGLPGSLEIALTGDLSDLRDAAQLAFGESPEARIETLTGPIDLRIGVTGTLDRPVVEGSFTISGAAAAVGEFPALRDLSLDVAFDEGMLRLNRLAATWQQAVISATGRLPAVLFGEHLPAGYAATLPAGVGGAQLDIRIENLTPAALEPWADPETLGQIAGRMTLVGSLEADDASIEALRGTLELERSDLTLAGVPMSQSQPTRLSIGDGRLVVEAWDWGSAGNTLTLAGAVGLTDDFDLDLAIDGQIDLRLLTVFVRDVAAGGEARLEATVSGPAAEPVVDGTLTVDRGEVRLAEPRLAITGLSGTVELREDRFVVRELTGTANGGSLRLSGELLHRDFSLQDGTLTVSGQGLAMDWPQGIRSEVDLDLTLRVTGGAPTLGGEVVVLRGAYREPVSLTGGLLGALRQRGALPPPVGPPGILDTIRLDIRLRTVEDLYVDNNLARLELGADLRVIGTAAAPALAGRASVREGGGIFLGGRTYRIETGAIDFTNPTRIEPDLNITALTRVSGYDVSLTLSGTPDTLDTDLMSPSDPHLSQSDLVSLLLTGRTFAELDTAGGDVAREQLLGYFSGELLGTAGRAIGLDAVRVETGFGREDLRFDSGLVATETDPGARLTIAKDLSRQVQLVLSQGLARSGLTWIAAYRPQRNLEARYVSQDNLDASYEFRHDVEFGGATWRAAAVSAEDRRPVSSLTFTGRPGFTHEELQRRVRLRPGRRFDFFRWQDDRDALLAFYHREGYLEAHVSASRDTPAGEVDLIYDIDRGPRTVLTMEGYSPPSRLRNELEELWSRSVFDQFLIEDLIAAVRLHFTARGHLRAAIAGEIVSDDAANSKEIVLRTDPGPRSTHREIRFAGNDEMGEALLNQLIRDSDLRDSAWIDPQALADAIGGLYYSEGFLATRVAVGRPEFDGERAVLPVTIEEGPLFRITSVAIEGTAARLEAEVARDLAIDEGSVYTDARIDAGRRRVETAYRSEGFNSVRVTLFPEFDREAGEVALSVGIDEGVQQVLGEVIVDAPGRTQSRVIEQALRLELGQPVDLASWYRARKRLYDTGVFRRADIDVEPLDIVPDAELDASSGAAPSVEPVRARVRLEEWAPFRIRYGLQVSDIQPADEQASRNISPGLTADFTHRNVLGWAATAGVSTRLSTDQRTGRTFATVPTFFGRPITSNLFLSRGRRFLGSDDRPFVVDVSDLTAEQRFRPGRSIEVSYGYNFQRNHTFERFADPDDPFVFDITVNVARFTSTTLVERRDDPFDATRGWFHSSGFEYASEKLGSDLRFARYFAQQFYYRPLRHGIVLASAGRLGLAAGFGQDLIPSERFFAGGRNTVRGYREDGLGPVSFFGDVEGGNAMLVLNQEIRFPIVRMIRGVGFLDVGNVFSTIGDLSATDLKAGVGFGFRIDTPFSLLRVDYGVPLADDRSGERRGRWMFSIGQVF